MINLGSILDVFSTIPQIATGWAGVVALSAALSAWVISFLKVTRNKNLLSRIKDLPERDRANVLLAEMGGVYLREGMSAVSYVKHQTQRYVLIAFLATLGAFTLLFVVALVAVSNAPKETLGVAPATASAQTDSRCRFLLMEVEEPLGRDGIVATLDGVDVSAGSGELRRALAVMKQYEPGETLRFSLTRARREAPLPPQESKVMITAADDLYVVKSGPDASLQIIPTTKNVFERYKSRADLEVQNCRNYRPGVTWLHNPRPEAGRRTSPETDVSATVQPQELNWEAVHPTLGTGACIDGKCDSETFIPVLTLLHEIERQLLPLTQVPRGSRVMVRDSKTQRDAFIVVEDSRRKVIANVWVGGDPLKDYKRDGLVRIGPPDAPPRVWRTFQRFSDGVYRPAMS